MIVNLRETTGRNADQAWLNSNLARFGGMMQGQRDLGVVSTLIMSELTPLVGARFGAFFLVNRARRQRAARSSWPPATATGPTTARRCATGRARASSARWPPTSARS